jgi:beta-phosphoglucomutase
MSDTEKTEAAARKNGWYVDYLRTLDESALLPGSGEFLERLKAGGVKTALGSASKNAPLILERLGIAGLFNAVIDGNAVSKAKPDPEVFLKGAKALGLSPGLCVVFEDALAGVEAARSGGMRVIAVGKPELLPGADRYISSLKDML